MKIITNAGGVACGRIYNIGNPTNDLSIRKLASMMLALAAEYAEYRDNAAKVRFVETTANAYHSPGYQGVRSRVPKIADTMRELDWAPRIDMASALRRIFDAYRKHVVDAHGLPE